MASVILAVIALLAAVVTGAWMPVTTEADKTGSDGFLWSYRDWTTSTEVIMWVGLSCTAALALLALATGLLGRARRLRDATDGQRHVLSLRVNGDLGIVLVLLVPLVFVVAEALSMTVVQFVG